ncbi:MAG: BNR-4 repeat-containing protein [Bacteroidales bacterium]|jgi:hypothetical protein|nr:BNR-4 repeat-containing protein [Bacteroidales bacterium]
MAITENSLPPTVALVGNQMFVDLETDEFAEDFIGLHMDPEVYIDGAWVSASQEMRYEPDANHKAVVDLSGILAWDPKKEFSFPESLSSVITKRNNLRRQWRLRRSEKYGNPLVEYNAGNAAGDRYILPGKIADIKQGQLNGFSSTWWNRLQAERFFLSNSPRTKKTDLSAFERLYYFVFGASVSEIHLKAKIYYTDESTSSVSKASKTAVSQYDVYEIVTSYATLGIETASKTVSKYEVWLVDQADNMISEVFTYVFDTIVKVNTRYYLFRNAYGMYEGVRFTGESEEGANIDFVSSTRKREKDYLASDMTLLKDSVKEAHNVKAYSGWLSIDELAWMRELILSREVYEVVDEVLRPLLIKTVDISLNKSNSNLRSLGIDYVYGHDSVPDIPYPAYNIQSFLHSTDESGTTLYLFGHPRFTPIYHYNDKTYVAYMQRQTSGYDSRACIFSFNHATNEESLNYDLKAVGDVTGTTDVHPMPSVIVADDGHIIVAQELPRLGEDHNDAMIIKRSDNAEDETSWVNAKAKVAGYWTYIGSWQPDNSQRLAYPLLHKDSSGNIYCICRRYAPGGRYITIFKSSDHGVTWDAGHDIMDSGSSYIWIAPNNILGGDSDTLRFSFEKQLKTGTEFREKIFYVESDDGGVTWRDVSNKFSKDTVANGPITLSELENLAYDFIAITAATDTPQNNVVPRGGTVDDSGIPYILSSEWSEGTLYDLRVVYWDGSSWQKKLITDGTSQTVNSHPILLHRKDTIFDLYYEEEAEVLCLIRTHDFVTWQKIRTVGSFPELTANTFIISGFTNNYKDTNNWMLINVYGTDAAYSDILCDITDGRFY